MQTLSKWLVKSIDSLKLMITDDVCANLYWFAFAIVTPMFSYKNIEAYICNLIVRIRIMGFCVLQYRLKHSILNILTFAFCITFVSSFLMSLDFQGNKRELDNRKTVKLSTEFKQLCHLDSYFLQVHLDLSDQQKKELQLLYSNYTNDLHCSVSGKEWRWLNLIEQIDLLLTNDQKEMFEKIIKNNIFFR
ncbi:hypothetical protein [Candidatus Uabimicrobium sp. HlEnr_7]|uniref:hypothetical protein n=1 Tax=Candidatus Uabimicrobium helgolandensis TaxID=3095367 RepID=UPI003558E861